MSKASIFCPECGLENPGNAKFCNSCGASLQVSNLHGSTDPVLTPIRSGSGTTLKDNQGSDDHRHRKHRHGGLFGHHTIMRVFVFALALFYFYRFYAGKSIF